MVRKWKLDIIYADGHTSELSKRFKTVSDAAKHFYDNYDGKPGVIDLRCHK